MPIYEFTITNTGSIIISANSKEEAINKIESMKSDEIYNNANLVGFEYSDIEEVF